MTISDAFFDALVSPRRAIELADVDDIFGFLIGSWDLEAVLHDPSGQTQRNSGELHAAWVLEGRAIQDLFIFPRRSDRTSGAPAQGDRYATTIRTYDRTLRVWTVVFINPASPETSAQLTARRQGPDIEMEGRLSNGTSVRWHYRSISATSFRYSAEKQHSNGMSWQLYLELLGSRSA
jgi:hypothetical protein